MAPMHGLIWVQANDMRMEIDDHDRMIPACHVSCECGWKYRQPGRKTLMPVVRWPLGTHTDAERLQYAALQTWLREHISQELLKWGDQIVIPCFIRTKILEEGSNHEEAVEEDQEVHH